MFDTPKGNISCSQVYDYIRNILRSPWEKYSAQRIRHCSVVIGSRRQICQRLTSARTGRKRCRQVSHAALSRRAGGEASNSNLIHPRRQRPTNVFFKEDRARERRGAERINSDRTSLVLYPATAAPIISASTLLSPTFLCYLTARPSHPATARGTC